MRIASRNHCIYPTKFQLFHLVLKLRGRLIARLFAQRKYLYLILVGMYYMFRYFPRVTYYPISPGIRVAQSERNVHPKPYVRKSQTLLATPCKEDTHVSFISIINHECFSDISRQASFYPCYSLNTKKDVTKWKAPHVTICYL